MIAVEESQIERRIPNNAKINASGKDSHWTFVLTVFTDLYSTHAFSFT